MAIKVAYIEVYRDESGDWRWRAKARNHKIVSESGEGYENRVYARQVVYDLFPGVDVIFLP